MDRSSRLKVISQPHMTFQCCPGQTATHRQVQLFIRLLKSFIKLLFLHIAKITAFFKKLLQVICALSSVRCYTFDRELKKNPVVMRVYGSGDVQKQISLSLLSNFSPERRQHLLLCFWLVSAEQTTVPCLNVDLQVTNCNS